MNWAYIKSSHSGLVIGLSVAVGLCIALHLQFASTSLWADELASEMFSSRPVSTLWSDWIRRETNPPLYYTLLKWWSVAVGYSDGAIRALSLLIGVSSVIACSLTVYSITKTAGPAIAAAVWTACSFSHIYHSQEIRAYALSHLTVLLSLYCFVKMFGIIHDERRTIAKWSAAYIASISIALYSHSTLVIIPTLCFILFALRVTAGAITKPQALAFLAANLILLVIYAWWMRITLWQLGNAGNVGWIPKPGLREAVTMTVETFLTGGLPLRNFFILLFLGLVSVLVLVGLWAYRRSPVLIYWVIAFGMPVALFVISQIKPVMLNRTIYAADGAFLVCVALGLSRIRSKRLQATASAAIAACLLAPIVVRGTPLTREPWRDAVRLISGIDRQALVVAENHTASLAISRYCVRPECDLRVITLRSHREVSTRGVPLPNSRVGYQVERTDRTPLFILARDTSRHDPIPGRVVPGRAAPIALDQDRLAGSPVKVFYSRP